MNNRFLSGLLLFLCLPAFGSAQETIQTGSLDKIEQNLQNAWQSFWGIAKTEGDNAGALTARGTGVGAGVLNFWDNHPALFKTLLGSACAVAFVRSQQYLSVKEHLDRARLFCRTPVPGVADPKQRDHTWLIYNLNGNRAKQREYCDALITNLASSSWLHGWLPELAQTHHFRNFDMNNIQDIYELLSIQAVKDTVSRRAAALGTLQYRHWLYTFGTWRDRVHAMWDARNDIGFFKSIGTALFLPYDGEATRLTFRLLEIQRELSR